MTREELIKRLKDEPGQKIQSINGRVATIVGVTQEHLLAIEDATGHKLAIPLGMVLECNPFSGQENPEGN